MEFLEHRKQIVALVGYDAQGVRTVISIVTHNEIEKATQVIFDVWPTTRQIHQFEIILGDTSQAVYTREVKESPTCVHELKCGDCGACHVWDCPGRVNACEAILRRQQEDRDDRHLEIHDRDRRLGY